MQRFIEHYKILLKNILIDPNQAISAIPMLSEVDKALLNQYYENKKFINDELFVHKFFSEAAKQFPDKIAAVFHHENGTTSQITYGELDKATNILAAYLTNIDIGPEKTIGVCLTRSLNLLIALLAIFKAGGVAVPMESHIPNDIDAAESPLSYKINDTMINNVIVDNQTTKLFKNFSSKLFLLNVENKEYEKVAKNLNLSYKPSNLSPNNLAYIMYTSGTTGKPKGVMVEHQNLTNLMFAIKDRNLPIGCKVLCTAPPTFDCFIWEILEAIVNIGECHIINENQRLSPITQQNIIQKFGINCTTLLPNTIKKLNPETLPSLIDIISMGSIPHEETINNWQKLGKSIRNEYGPTETTICSTQYTCLPGVPFTVIGKPIPNCTLFILDDNLNVCPPNVPGEIYIGGKGVSRGYVDKTLTSQKFPTLNFFPDQHLFKPLKSATKNFFFTIEETQPHSKRKAFTETIPQKKQKKISSSVCMRLYATGDLANYIVLPDQTLAINFIGRKDRQMKIHGVRIEIDGVESILRSHPDIKEVYLKPNTINNALIAYIIPKDGAYVTKEMIHAFLRKTSLPAVAWPMYFIHINEFPLTKNGKIDLKALPLPKAPLALKYQMPKSAMQIQLCDIWGEILHIPSNEIDVTKSFADHGGDSLTLGHLELALNNAFEYSQISINDLSPEMTINSLEELINLSNFSSERNERNYSPLVFCGDQQDSLAFKPVSPLEAYKKNILR